MEEYKRSHIASLDGVRGLAILLVVVFHCAILFPNEEHHLIEKVYRVIASMGWCGVDLFFVLSGFLITGILLDSRKRSRYFVGFYMRRVLRILPLFYGTLLIVFLFMGPVFAHTTQQEQFRWLAERQAWFWTSTQNWLLALYKWPDNIFGHLWSLAIEEQFYILWPLIVFLTRPPRLRTVCVSLILGSLAVRIAVWSACSTEVALGMSYYMTFARMDGLAGGALLAVMAREDGGLNRYVKYAPPMMIAGLAVFAATFLADRYAHWRSSIDTLGLSALVILFGAIILASLTFAKTHPIVRFFSWRPMRFFGKYSYAIFIFHWPVMMLTAGKWKTLSEPIFPNPMVRQLSFLIVSGGLTVGLSLMSWFLIEKRCLAMKRFFE